ncbi:Aste57867_18846 [Aphanomyces stellatus]|uniref:Aste57867_18846 protein n=1 Tax=Aphanomyces stellatus TaxID=120398 RepID=A0A485LBG9_9STRA|nr:hypothetical protein As57867_018782 [Aphanomyces stellatus]VFT95580.1 Aste57867_18846 [Aphanomyces stellatus]
MCSIPISTALLAFAGFVLSVIAVSLPDWSASSPPTFAYPFFQASKLSAGLWGFCIAVQVDPKNASAAAATSPYLEGCFPFRARSTGFALLTHNESILIPEDSVCSLDRRGAKFDDLVRLSSVDSTRAYVAASCGSMGWASVVFAVLAPIFGLLALALLGALVCTRAVPTRRRVLVATTPFLALACISAIVVFSIWTHQAPRGVTYGASFVLEILAAVAYLAALGVALGAICRRDEDAADDEFLPHGQRNVNDPLVTDADAVSPDTTAPYVPAPTPIKMT